jgi:hypothetical protein
VAFSVELTQPGAVKWMVTDVLGRVVFENSGAFGAGRAMVRWSGVNTHGKQVPAGIYVIRLDANGETLTRHFAVVH